MDGTDRGCEKTVRPSTVRPWWGKALAVLSLVALAALTVRTARAQSADKAETVADVVIRGNRHVTSEKIMRMLRTRPGTAFSYANLQEDAKRLLETNMFRNVRPHDHRTTDERTGETKLVVYFDVQEYPTLVKEVIYKHAGHISQKELDEMTRVRKGAPLDPTLNRQACFEIQDYLRKKGRYFASVALEEGDKVGDERVVFNVSEGPVVRVKSTNFKGQNELASAARLRTQIDTSRPFLWLIGGAFNPASADGDVMKLEEYYRANGYLDVKVSRELKFSDDLHWVDITYHIKENQRYRVKDVTVEGAKQLPRDQVASIVRVRSGDYYNETKINADLRNITDLYGWRGMGVMANKELYFPEPGVVRVQYEVREKGKTQVGQVIIVGNEVTQDRVIRRMAPLYPGQILQFPEVRTIEANLARSQLFEVNPELGIRPTVQLIEREGSDVQDVVIHVKETKTGSLLLGAGINSDAGFVGSIVLNEKNFDVFRIPTSIDDILEGRAFRGAGQEFRLEAVPGTELQRYTVSIREPYLFDLPYDLTASGFYWDRVFNEYTEGRAGGRFTLGHRFTRYLSAFAGIRLENVQVSDVASFAPADYLEARGGNALYAPRVGVTFDTRDSILRPTEGGIYEASYEQVFGDFQFPVFNVEGSHYFTTYQRPDGSGRHVLALRSQLSWAGDDAPVFERFYGGGFRSLRGFEFRGVGPFQNGFNLGGRFMFMNSIEYQVPVLANDNFYLVAFLDSGTVESKFSIRDYRVSAGVGMRLIVPMLGPVPISLDFGFPINSGRNDREQIFSFWIGYFR